MNLLFLDLQTTGMRPPAGQILEIGWVFLRANGEISNGNQLFSLTEGRTMSRKVQEITGLTESDLIGLPIAEEWFRNSFPQIVTSDCHATLVHYAQFERPYFEFHQLALPPVLCTQILTARLLPTLPSRNLRAVSGHFGHPLLGPNRAGPFAIATKAIWLGLKDHLKAQGLDNLEALTDWLKEKPKKSDSKRQITYRIESRIRLNLPDRPGIYRMKAKDGSILYVGKATSLKDRVNSYFRGVKNRDRKKLEMLAQVWDLEVQECRSPLEAALTETDEIKRLNPPYNIALKKNRRELVFYDRDFKESSSQRNSNFFYGPFRPGGWVDMMAALCRSLDTSELADIFFLPIDPEILKSGLELFMDQHYVSRHSLSQPRKALALALKLYRKLGVPTSPTTADEDDIDKDHSETEELTTEEMAAKFERLFRRTGASLAHARSLNAARNSLIEYKQDGTWRRLEFQHGRWNLHCPLKSQENISEAPEWDIETFDRLSILLSELNRLEHRILRQR